MTTTAEPIAAAPEAQTIRAVFSSAIGHAAAIDNSRYAINSIAIVRSPTDEKPDNAYSIATNGRTLLACNGCELTGADKALMPASFLRTNFKKVESNAGGRVISGDGKVARFGDKVADMMDPQLSPFPPCADIFDACAKRLADRSHCCITLNTELLDELSRSMRRDGHGGAVTLLIPLAPAKDSERGEPDSGKPILVIPAPSDGDDAPAAGAVGVIMPCANQFSGMGVREALVRLNSAAAASKRLHG